MQFAQSNVSFEYKYNSFAFVIKKYRANIVFYHKKSAK